MLPKKYHLPRTEFRARGYQTIATPYFLLKTKDNPLSVSRLGVVVGTTVDKRAAQRNFWERQIKAQFLRGAQKGKDFLVIVLPKIKQLKKADFAKEFSKAMKSIKLS